MKALLVSEFSDRRSEKILLQDLIRLRVFANETYYDFGEKINRLAYKMTTKIQLNDSMPEDEKAVNVKIV